MLFLHILCKLLDDNLQTLAKTICKIEILPWCFSTAGFCFVRDFCSSGFRSCGVSKSEIEERRCAGIAETSKASMPKQESENERVLCLARLSGIACWR
jgi:hypothetical protein